MLPVGWGRAASVSARASPSTSSIRGDEACGNAISIRRAIASAREAHAQVVINFPSKANLRSWPWSFPCPSGIPWKLSIRAGMFCAFRRALTRPPCAASWPGSTRRPIPPENGRDCRLGSDQGIPGPPGDRHAQGFSGPDRADRNGAAPRTGLGPLVRVYQSAAGPDQDSVLGRVGVLYLVQAPRARPLPVAGRSRRGEFTGSGSHGGAVVSDPARDRLEVGTATAPLSPRLT